MEWNAKFTAPEQGADFNIYLPSESLGVFAP